MTIKEFRDRLPIWKQRLNLTNWTIAVHRGTAKTLRDRSGNDLVGRIVFSTEEELADIYIARGEGEDTLVHELLHLVYDDHKQDREYDPLHERALNRTAKALVELSSTLSECQEQKLQKISETSPKS